MARNNGSGVVDSKLTEALVGMTGPFGESSGPLTPRVNLLNWDGCGTSDRLMPQSAGRHRK